MDEIELKNNLLNSFGNFSNKFFDRAISEIYKNDQTRVNELNNSIIKSQINNSKILNNNNKNNNNNNKYIEHKGIKCEQCGLNPIIGERYQCEKCRNYNLCEKCEENNYYTKEHNHNFIRIREEKKNNGLIPFFEIGQVSNYNFENESSPINFEIKNLKDQYIYYNDIKNYLIDFRLKNTGNKKWPKNIELICDKENSNIYFDNQQIKAIIAPQDECSISINFNDYNYKLKNKIYKCRLKLKEIDENNYSNNYYDIKIKVDNYGEIQVNKFKEKYSFMIFDNRFTNEIILNCLEKNQYDMEKTYDDIFNFY